MSSWEQEREEGGKLVWQAWIIWARTQPNPKPSWLLPWEELAEPDKEADRYIWETITAPYRKISQEEINCTIERIIDAWPKSIKSPLNLASE